MKLSVLLLSIIMLTGCGIARNAQIAEHREDYQQCLRDNAGSDEKCMTEKKIYEADYPKGSPQKSGMVCTQAGNTTVCN